MYAALKWAVSNAESLRASPEKDLLVGGQSAGAQMSAAVALRARDDPFFKGHPLTGQILQIPPVVHPDAIPAKYRDQLLSMEQNKDAPILDAGQHHAILTFLGVSADDISFSPLLAASHANLPPAVVQVCGLDPLRDEGFLYERVLREAAVKTKLYVYPGVPHGFSLAFAQIKAAVRYNAELDEGIKWLLRGAA